MHVCLCLSLKRGKQLSGTLHKRSTPSIALNWIFIIAYLPPFSSCHGLWQLLYTSASDNSSINPPTFTCSVKSTQTSHSAVAFITAKPARMRPRAKMCARWMGIRVNSSIMTLQEITVSEQHTCPHTLREPFYGLRSCNFTHRKLINRDTINKYSDNQWIFLFTINLLRLLSNWSIWLCDKTVREKTSSWAVGNWDRLFILQLIKGQNQSVADVLLSMLAMKQFISVSTALRVWDNANVRL